MKNESQIEQKKIYTAPKMDVVEIKHQVNLLQESNCPGYCNEAN
jgi:hypothetical protein